MPLSYDHFRWTLFHDLDTDAIVQQIKEQTGKFPHQYIDLTGFHFVTEPLDISYTFSHPDGRGMCVALKEGQTREICLEATHQESNSSRWLLGQIAFYHAHQVFSPQKIMAMLNGKILPKHIWQLIDEAWTH